MPEPLAMSMSLTLPDKNPPSPPFIKRGMGGCSTQSRAVTSCAVVVLGAGRSGTSAVTRGLQALEVDLGDKLRPGRGKNPTGFFEDQDLLALNKRLKRLLNMTGESVRLIAKEQWQAQEIRALQDEAGETIRRRFGTRALWGYKYGRTLRFLPFWENVFQSLDLDVRYVVALRNPLSVACSRAKLDPQRGTQEKSDLEWLVNVVPYFREVTKRPFVVVDYDAVMADPVAQLKRIAASLHLPDAPEALLKNYTKEFLRPNMRHSTFTIGDLEGDDRVNPLTKDAYGWLHRLAHDEVKPDSPELWKDWQRIEKALEALASVLRHIDQVQHDLRCAQRHILGPLQALPQAWRAVRGR